MKHLLVWLIVLCGCALSYGQTTAPSIKGRVTDAKTGSAIEFANAIIVDSVNHTIASTTVSGGEFSISDPINGDYYLIIQLMGYQPYTSERIAFRNGTPIDIGTVPLEPIESLLQEVTVVGNRSAVIYKLDRKKISGSASLSASGGTAVDILRTIPSVRIDADGELSFRGSTGFLVHVDGKPSMLSGTQALEQIPASTIEDIEIITTPSARYKTDGEAGIINIVTKRHSDEGTSGNISLSGSTLGAWNADLLLSHRKGAHRWYIGGTGSEIKGKSDFNQQKTTIVDDFTTTSDADGTRHSNNASYIGKVGWEYATDRHNLLLEVQSGMTKNARGGDMGYYEHRTQGSTVLNDAFYDSHDRYSNEKQLAQLTADYSFRINERGDKFTLNGRLRYDWYALEYTESNMFDTTGVRYEGTRGYEKEHHWDFDGGAAYELNYRPDGKLELGYQYTSYSEHGDYNITYWDRDRQEFEWQEDLYAPFFYRRQIHSFYAMLTDRIGPVSFDAGLRADNTLDELQIAVANANRNISRLELFPSAHIAYEAPHDQTISAGYAYRTNRPGIWQLEPYITYEDYYTKQIGNPDICPEYIHSAEIGYRKQFSGDNSLAFTGFFRSRRGVIDRVRVAYEPGVTLDSLINAGNDRSGGLEIAARIKAARWWQMSLNGSLFGYKFTSRYEGCEDASNLSYAIGMINNFTLGATTRMQFDANVVGPTVLTQGREEAYCYFDLAIRQQICKNRISAAVVIHDLFHTALYRNRRATSTLLSTTRVRPKYPNIVLSLSYSFNTAHKEQSGRVSSGAMFDGKDF